MARVGIEFTFEVDINASTSPFNADTKGDKSGTLLAAGERELRLILDRFENNLRLLFPETSNVEADASVRLSSLHGENGNVTFDFPSLDLIAAQPLVANNLPKIADMMAEAIVSVFNTGWTLATVAVGKQLTTLHPSGLGIGVDWIELRAYTPATAARQKQHINSDRFAIKYENLNSLSTRSKRFPKLASGTQIAAASIISAVLQFAFFAIVLWVAMQGQNRRQQELIDLFKEARALQQAPVVDLTLDIQLENTLLTPNDESPGGPNVNEDPCDKDGAIRIFIGGKKTYC